MSTPSPGSSRRRRIAGERRGRPGQDQEQATRVVAGVGYPEPVDEPDPVSLEKDRKKKGRKGGSAAAPAAPAAPAAAEEAAERPTGWWGSRMSLVLLTAALVMLLALIGLAALGLVGTDSVKQLNDADAAKQAEQTAPAAAEGAAAAILAYDYKSLDADEDTAKRYMTSDFAKKYSDTFQKVVKPAAQANHARVTATVLASAAVRTTPDTARVIVFVDQATTSAKTQRPKLALNRVEMSMVREGGTWLVDDISSY